MAIMILSVLVISAAGTLFLMLYLLGIIG